MAIEEVFLGGQEVASFSEVHAEDVVQVSIFPSPATEQLRSTETERNIMVDRQRMQSVKNMFQSVGEEVFC